VPPYITLDFDQYAIARDRKTVDYVSTFQTIEHLSHYGRPLYVSFLVSLVCVFTLSFRWRAGLPESKMGELVQLASAKLIGVHGFQETDKMHVFAVLSQRICLDAALAGAEAIKLADRSVAHHMRLLTGFSDNRSIFYTHSPSEPILVLGAIDILYDSSHPKRLGNVLNTLSRDLCGAGLVDKGMLGELAARILLLTARDYAAPKELFRRNLLKPVRLLEVINKLFGTTKWGGSKQEEFDNAFANAYVNFTHWIITKDSLPEKPSR
jgi:hypothetical protein